MNTISLISNISYNTPEFFELVIQSLTNGKDRLIDWAHWIVHRPEDDETKQHIHFILKPSRRIDTNELRKKFEEPVTPDMLQSILSSGKTVTPNDLKPRGVLPFDKTKNVTDWLLYAVHDVRYLLKKGQTRRHHYEKSDVHSTDPDFLAVQWGDTIDPLQALTQRILELRAQEKTFGEILATGLIPPNMVFFYRSVFYETPTNRGGKEGHE